MQADSFLRQNVMGCALQVHRVLGPGFLESIDEQALRFEFQKKGIHFQFQEEKEVLYETEKVGLHRYDFLIEGRLIVELEYRVRRTNQVGNLVFPFYFREGGRP